MTPDPSHKHKLAAIMFTDLVGYSALSHTREALALALLAEHRRLVREILKENQGEEIKTIGDAFLVKFDSALDAVRCAIQIQRLHQERNQAAPQSERIRVRIGIHLGDVVFSEGDVYGDGVNIASRLQSIAQPGRISVSVSVYQQVKNKIDRPVTALGSLKLKNIDSPVEVFEIKVDESDATGLLSYRRVVRGWQRLRLPLLIGAGVLALGLSVLFFQRTPTVNAAHRRLAVLPFRLIGGIGTDEFLAEGLAEELVHNLSRLDGVHVLARQSVVPYRNSMKSISEIGQELEVGALILGSIQKNGTQLRIMVQFVDVKTQANVWSQEFDADVARLFETQKNLALAISNRLAGGLGRGIVDANQIVPNQRAYELFLRGRYFANRRTLEDLKRAEGFLLEAVDLDPGFAPAFSVLASVYDLQGFYGGIAPRQAAEKINEYAAKALKMDPNAPDALISLAEARAYFEHRWSEAEALFKKAIAANPGNALSHQWLAELYEGLGRFDDAEKEVNASLELDRLALSARTAAGHIQYFKGNLEKAEAYLRGVLDVDPAFMVAHYWLSRVLLAEGRLDEALATAQRAVELSKRSSLALGIYGHILGVSGKKVDALRVLDELHSRAQKEYISSYDVALVQMGLNDYGKSTRAIAEAIENRSVLIVHLKNDPVFAPLRGNPDFGLLVRRIGI